MNLKLVSVVKESSDVKSFFWKPENKVEFKSGQYFYYTLPNLKYPDARGATRHFTIASSSIENYLQLTTKIHPESGYKKTLDEMPVGSIIQGEGPLGTFVFEGFEYASNVFLAGGIGITPYRSIIKYSLDKEIAMNMHLVSCNSGPEFIYKKELDAWASETSNLKISYLDTLKEGRLDIAKLKIFLDKEGTQITNSIYWITGPPAFVDAAEAIVSALGVDYSHIKTEKFTGY